MIPFASHNAQSRAPQVKVSISQGGHHWDHLKMTHGIHTIKDMNTIHVHLPCTDQKLKPCQGDNQTDFNQMYHKHIK